MLIVRMNKTNAPWTQTVGEPVDRKLDVAFTNEPHLGVHVMVRSMRSGAGRQRGLVDLQRLTGSQLTLEDAAHFGVVENLHGQLVKRIVRRGQELPASAKAASAAAAGKRPGSTMHISRRVIVICSLSRMIW